MVAFGVLGALILTPKMWKWLIPKLQPFSKTKFLMVICVYLILLFLAWREITYR
jgi:hypothetical protein